MGSENKKQGHAKDAASPLAIWPASISRVEAQFDN
jgi:hypothetical protein